MRAFRAVETFFFWGGRGSGDTCPPPYLSGIEAKHSPSKEIWIAYYSLIQFKGYNSQIFWWCTVQKIFYFFTCILLDYMANGITKEFWKNIHFENMTAGFLPSCQNWLRWEISFLCHSNIDSWKQKMSLGHVMVPKNYQNII